MDFSNEHFNRYDRVKFRVHNSSRSSLKSSSYVSRNDTPPSVRVGAKQYVSNVSSRVFSELPTVLNDYVPESSHKKPHRNLVIKPRKTIKSLDPALSLPRTVKQDNKFSIIRGRQSAPAIIASDGEKWSNTHLRECLSSRSHSRLKDLKDEIKSYKETERLMRLRSSLYKKCGVVLDDAGNVAQDKAVQVEVLETKCDDTGQDIRFRYPNEYIATPESVLTPDDIPDDLYANLIDERPDLEPILGPLRKTRLRRPNLPYLRRTTMYPQNERNQRTESNDVMIEYEFGNRGNKRVDYSDAYKPKEQKEIAKNETRTKLSESSLQMLPFLARSPKNGSRKFIMDTLNNIKESLQSTFLIDHPFLDHEIIYKATCYVCGMTGDIPKNPICHDAFESDDWRSRTLARYFRAECYYNWNRKSGSRKKQYTWKGTYTYTEDRGLKTQYSGDYRTGCYKRFLDIGKVHTSRGCRMNWPQSASKITSHRFRRLEFLLNKKKDACIVSPHASLVPFSRSISLWARFHVCVCSKKYCNGVSALKHSYLFIECVCIIHIIYYFV